MLLMVLGGLARAESAVHFPLAAGDHALRATMVMPHLEEMRRISTQIRRCVDAGAVVAFFPVLEQPALRGCRPMHGCAADAAVELLQVCMSTRCASGPASLRRAGTAVLGQTEVKMGGKNMIFSQHVKARRQGDCGTQD